MKTKDFETAIAALNLGIVIDEMKIRHSDVRQVIAHQGDKDIVWDEYGRAFTTIPEKDMYIAPHEDSLSYAPIHHSLNRNKLYDLKFD